MSTPNKLFVRPATADDVDRIATIHVQSWQAAYRGLINDEVLDGLSVEQRANMWRRAVDHPSAILLVADSGEEIVGFVSANQTRDDDAGPEVGEIFAIYTDPAVWETGAGYALYQAACAKLVKRTFTTVSLWVLAGNDRAIRFYERVGFVRDSSPNGIKTDQLGAQTITEWRYTHRLVKNDER